MVFYSALLKSGLAICGVSSPIIRLVTDLRLRLVVATLNARQLIFIL